MTNHNFLKKLKFVLITLFAALFLFCAQFFCLTACANNGDATSDATQNESAETEDTEVKDPSYTFKDPDDGEIANANFTKGTANKDLDDYPLSSPSDWSKSYDNGAVSSNVNSGVIDISKEGWEEVSKKLLDDKDLIEVLSYQKHGDKSTEHLNDIKDKFDTEYFKNPGLYSQDALDSKIYMLNNYSSSSKYVGSGTAQYIQSSSKITIEKGKTAKISVWVYTMNLAGQGNPENRGANILLTNKINGVDQNNYKISSIDTNNAWKKYEIYVTADENYSSTVSVRLGLGYGGGKSTAKTFYTEGTVFFDDLTYEIVDTIPTLDAKFITKLDLTKPESYFEKNAFEVTDTSYHYDMNLDDIGNSTLSASAFTDTKGNTDKFFTLSNVEGQSGNISTETIFGNTISKIDRNGNEFTLSNASASIKLSSPEWKLTGKNYAFVSFTIKNDLKIVGATNISIDVYDKFGTKEIKQADVITIEKPSDTLTVCNLLIKNNFSSTTDEREFYIVVNVGPTDLSAIENISDVATGKVTISDVSYYKAEIPAEEVEDKNYAFISTTANKTVALYAGYAQDAEEDKEANETYTLNTKPSEIGAIITGPAKAKDYFGVEANHSYVSNDSNVYALDTRTGNGDANGSYAGLINTKYLNNYSLSSIPVGSYTDNIQPLMIYNNTLDNYGYIGKSFTVSSASYSKVTMKVRVVGDAVAYIYLVDVSGANKNVLTFDNFTANASSMVTNKGANVNGNTPLMLKIDQSVMTNKGEDWVDVEFYIATGASSKEIRIEVWNGSRDGVNKSQGYVFFNDINHETPSKFDGTTWEGAFEDKNHPLFDVVTSLSSSDVKSLVSYKRPLTDIEKQFNEEYKGQKEFLDHIVEYKENYIWAETSTMIYAVYNTIDPVAVDPYSLIETEEEPITEEEQGSGCSAASDPSSFWLSFSSIILGVILVIAIVALFIKNYLRKHRVGPDDHKSHYNVSSRIRSQREINRKKAEQKALEEEQNNEPLEDIEEVEQIDEQEETGNETTIEQELDDYVYGEVIEDFTTTPNQTEDSKEENDNNEN